MVKEILEKAPEAVNSIAKAPPKWDAGKSPLLLSIEYTDLEIANYLLTKGADVNFMEPDDGLSWIQHRRMPVLSQTIVKFYSILKGIHRKYDGEKHIEFLSSLLSLGADPNLNDNCETTAWMHTIFSARELLCREDDENREKISKLTTSILEMLIENGADIYYIGEEKMNELYRKFIQNVIFNQDICQGVEDNEKEQWKKSWGSMESIVRPFYMKNNPYYGESVSVETQDFFEHLAEEAKG